MITDNLFITEQKSVHTLPVISQDVGDVSVIVDEVGDRGDAGLIIASQWGDPAAGEDRHGPGRSLESEETMQRACQDTVAS